MEHSIVPSGRHWGGYVYSSAFITPEQAEQEFRQHLGPRSEGCNALHIKMRIGRNRNSWVKNCVAIGLSSGFVEPLESTGIFFIHHAVEQLLNHFPGHGHDEESRKSYNEIVGNCMDGVREFLTLHYVASTRQDNAFWKATKQELAVPDGLRERLKLWQHRLPTDRNINPNYHGFPAYSYCVMLLGLRRVPKQSLPVLNHMPDTEALLTFEAIRDKARQVDPGSAFAGRLPHGKIWRTGSLCRAAKRRVHSPSWNAISWGVALVSDYSTELLSSASRDNLISAFASLHAAVGIDPNALRLHKEDPKTTHNCPGKTIVKGDEISLIFQQLSQSHDCSCA